MENENQASGAKKERRNWRIALLWTAAAALIVVCMVPLCRLLWSDRTQTHTWQECEMVADALLKQSVRSQRSNTKEVLARRQGICARGALAGWACLYGGLDQEELDQIFDENPPDAVALLGKNGYHVLLGDFPREEFDAAMEAREEDALKQLTNLYQRDADSTEFMNLEGVLEGTCVLSRIGDVFYYSAAFVESDALVISKKAVDPVTIQNDFYDVMSFEGMIMSVSGINAVMVRRSDNTVTLTKGETGLSQGDLLDKVPDGDGKLKIGDTWYVAGMSENNDYRMLAMVPVSLIPSKSILSPLFPAVLFALLFFMTVLYAWFLRADFLRGRVEKESSARSRGNPAGMLVRHVRLMNILITVCTCLLFFLVSMLCVVDSARVWGRRILLDAEDYFQEDNQNAQFLDVIRTGYELSFSDSLSSLANGHPERMETDALFDLGMAVGRDFYVLNRNGSVAASSQMAYDFTGLLDPDAGWGMLTSVLKGEADYVESVATINGTPSVCWAVRRKDRNGMLLSVDILSETLTISEYYAGYKMPPGLILFSVDKEAGVILTSSQKSFSGMDASSVGLTEEVCGDGFAGEITLDGRRYFIQSNVQSERTDLIAVDLMYLTVLYLPVVLETIAFGIVLVLLMLSLVYFVQRNLWTNLEPAASKRKNGPAKAAAASFSGKKAEEKESKEEREERLEKEKESEENASFYRERAGDLYAERAAVGRWLRMDTPFRAQSADEKFRYVIHILCVILFAGGYLFYHQKSAAGIMGSTIAYLLQRNWQFGLNVYSISYALLVVLAIFVASLAIRRVIILVGMNFGDRAETIARLLSSFVGYAAALSALAYSLMYLGVNTMTIIASAGIIGLGVSIGAKDLVSDILAGISIVFEGEFRAGDIVEINGFRGSVEEIGIRTTKVMSMGNVKVFRNSEVSGVINLTQRYSIAQVQMYVSRAESLEEVEKIFRRELPRIRRKIPQTVEAVELCGISELNHSFMLLLFQTKCREKDRVSVERMLSRELDLVMERENIETWGMLRKNK